MRLEFLEDPQGSVVVTIRLVVAKARHLRHGIRFAGFDDTECAAIIVDRGGTRAVLEQLLFPCGFVLVVAEGLLVSGDAVGAGRFAIALGIVSKVARGLRGVD